MHSCIIHTCYLDCMRSPRISILTELDTPIQYNKDTIPKNGIYFKPGGGYNFLKNKGGQIILMGDINKYILSRKIRPFTFKLIILELITDIHISMVPDTTRSNKKQQEIYGIWGSQGIYISQVGYPPSTLALNQMTDSCGSRLYTQLLS